MKRGIINSLASVVLALSAASCVTEVDVGTCENTVVEFKYYADGSEDVLPQYISSVTCLVYDANSSLVQETELSANDLAEFQGVRLLMETPGDYRMVCWGNIGSESQLALNNDEGLHFATISEFAAGRTPRTHDPLYLGTLDFSVSHPGDIREDLEVVFHAAHITLVATLESEDAARADDIDSYSLEIEGMPLNVTHMGASAGESVSYIPDFVADAQSGKLTATCELPRFDENTQAMVHVHNNTLGEKAASVSLAKYIADNDIHISGREEVIIEMNIRLNGTQVSITFPGWKHDQVTPRV